MVKNVARIKTRRGRIRTAPDNKRTVRHISVRMSVKYLDKMRCEWRVTRKLMLRSLLNKWNQSYGS